MDSPSSFPSKQEGPISEVVPPPAINSILVPEGHRQYPVQNQDVGVNHVRVNLDERMARHEADRAAARLALSRREGGGGRVRQVASKDQEADNSEDRESDSDSEDSERDPEYQSWLDAQREGRKK